MELCTVDQCTGCLACYNACNKDAIQLINDEEGFVRPVIKSNLCVECGACVNACPVFSAIEPENKEPIDAYAAWSRDRKIVRKSSSGGFFPTIASWIYSNGGVVYGAAFDESFNLQHIRTTSENELNKLVGSKYLQSFIGYAYKQVKQDLKNGLQVLFVGTPCQISGLNSFLGDKINKSQLITIDLVCHGVPTPTMFREYKNYLEKKYNSKLEYYSFRDKKWSWFHFNTHAIFSNKKEYYGKWEEDIFMRGFLREYFLRPSCHKCLYANLKRQGDFTIADYWGYIYKKGEKKNRDKGINVVFVNTKKASLLLHNIEDKLNIYYRPLAEAVRWNEALASPFPENARRKDFWNDYKSKGYKDIVEEYLYPEPMSRETKLLYLLGPRLMVLRYYAFAFLRKIKRLLIYGK